jgi:hypothetical protein
LHYIHVVWHSHAVHIYVQCMCATLLLLTETVHSHNVTGVDCCFALMFTFKCCYLPYLEINATYMITVMCRHYVTNSFITSRRYVSVGSDSLRRLVSMHTEETDLQRRV